MAPSKVWSTEKQRLLERIKDDVAALVLDHGYNQGGLYRELTEHLREAVQARGEPPQRVVYNTVHGGFGYHPRFRQHCRCAEQGGGGDGDGNKEKEADADADAEYDEPWDGDEHHRVDMQDALRSFGAAMLAAYPAAGAQVARYLRHRRAIEAGLANARTFAGLRSDAQQLERFLNHAGPWSDAAAAAAATGSPTPADRRLSNACEDADVTDATNAKPLWLVPRIIEQLGDLSGVTEGTARRLAPRVRALLDAVRQRMRDLEAATPRLREFLRTLRHRFPEEAAEEQRPWYDRRKWHERLTPDDGVQRFAFLDALDAFGQDHFAVWQCQHALPEMSMRHLMLHPMDDEEEEKPEDYDVELAFGLLCASGAYCNLAIAEVPARLAWRVSQYDGKERVCVL